MQQSNMVLDRTNDTDDIYSFLCFIGALDI